MTRNSHIVIGGLSAYVLGFPVLPAIIGSVAPDIDIIFSKGQGLFMSHRGITHHVILCGILLILSLLSKNPVLISFMIGYTSHLWADSLTIKGIPYWTNKDRISVKLFKTGHAMEKIFVITFCFTLLFVLLIKQNFYIPVDFKLIEYAIRMVFPTIL